MGSRRNSGNRCAKLAEKRDRWLNPAGASEAEYIPTNLDNVTLAIYVATMEVADQAITAPQATDMDHGIARTAKQVDVASHRADVRRRLGQAVRGATVFFNGSAYQLAAWRQAVGLRPGGGAGAAEGGDRAVPGGWGDCGGVCDNRCAKRRISGSCMIGSRTQAQRRLPMEAVLDRHIECTPGVRSGQPRIAGTRIVVARLASEGSDHPGIACCPVGARSIGEIMRSLILIYDVLVPDEFVGRVAYP